MFSSKLNADTSSSNAFPSRSNGNAFNLVDGTNSLSLSVISTNINLSDTYLGFGFSLTNSNPYGIGVPPLFNYDMFIDFSVMRQFFNIDNQQFNVAVGAIPQISFADVSIQYTYRILNSSGSLVTKDGSETLRLPMEVYFDNYFSNGGGHGAHVKIHGFQFDDLKKFQQYGYFNDLTLEDVQSFTCTTISVNGYAYYSLSDYFNFSNNSPYNSYDSFDVSYYVGMQNIADYPWSVNLTVSELVANDSNTFSLSNISKSLTSLFSSVSSNMGSIVTNATDNANRIIQNTTQKVDEVKQGVTEVKDSVVETKNSILDLPNKIKEMLTGFFVPDEETINSKFAEFETLLSDRFGLIYQSADIIHDFADSLQTQAVMVADTGGVITLPSVTVNLAGTDFTFGGYDVDVIPNGFEVLQTAVRLATSMVCTVVFVNMLKNKLEAILK